MKRFFVFALLLALPLQLVAAQPSVSTDTGWVSDVEAPVEYTHVRDGYVLDISYEAYFNRYRERLGVPRLKVSSALQNSAAAHASYLVANGVGYDPHGEVEGLEGFTGSTTHERCLAAGYGSGACTEVQAGGATDGDGYSAIDALMMTPYHRATMMYPYITEIGCALESGYFVCDLGIDFTAFFDMESFPSTAQGMTYPYDGQVISTTFYVSENPMPYPEYAYDFIGPTLMYWPMNDYGYVDITSAEVSLYDLTAGASVPDLVRLELGDAYTFGGVFFNPIEPLELDHEYAARVTGESDHGSFDHSWTFKTQSSSKIDFPNGWENITYDASVHWVGDTSTQSVSTPDADVRVLTDRLEGWIMLAVDRAGEAYYVDPVTKARYYLRDGPTAYEFLRTFGLGITTANLETIPEVGSGEAVTSMARSLAGRILLQVDSVGEAWYVHPETYERHYMADGDEAYRIMRELSEGTMYEWIQDIPEGIVQ